MDSRTDTRSAWAVYAALLFGTFITIEAAAFQAPALPSVTRHFGIPVNMAALVLILQASFPFRNFERSSRSISVGSSPSMTVTSFP